MKELVEVYEPGSLFKKQEYIEIDFSGPITDPHGHGRGFDKRLPINSDIGNGKAGFKLVTKAALLGGIDTVIFMPNESLRLPNPDTEDGTELIPYPITTVEKLLVMAQKIATESYVEASINMGVDRNSISYNEDTGEFSLKEIHKTFSNKWVAELTAGLKIYCDKTTGNYDMPEETVIPVAEVWHTYNPDKPVVLHAEGEKLKRLLESWPKEIPVHIAHISTEDELVAKIIAKENGLNITCELTPHHATLTDKTKEEIGPYGCVRPPLGKQTDRDFLIANLHHIDMIASDCAPHRKLDKEKVDPQGRPDPAYGVTNHDTLMAIFLQMAYDGKLTFEELARKIITKPRARFNLPPRPHVRSRWLLIPADPQELTARTEYGYSPFVAQKIHGKTAVGNMTVISSEIPKMRGYLQLLQQAAGRIAIHEAQLTDHAGPQMEHLIRFRG